MSNFSGVTKLLSELEEGSFSEEEFLNQFLLIGASNLFKMKPTELFEAMRKAVGYPKIDSGRESVPIIAANTPSPYIVKFNKPFAKIPHVTATAVSTVIGTSVLGVSVSNITNNEFTIYVTRGNNSDTSVEWIAVGN